MLAHWLLTFYRSVARHRLYAAINVLGLALGVAVFLVLMLVVHFETSFEAWIPHADQIYVIRAKNWVVGGWDTNTKGALLDELRGDYPQLVGTRVGGDLATVRQGATITPEQLTWVDPSFFQVFDLPWIAGDRTQALQTPDEIVIAQSTARKYFGVANPIGQRLTFSLNKKVRTYRVTGVIKDPPPTTDLQFDFLIRLVIPTPEENPRWRSWNSRGYRCNRTCRNRQHRCNRTNRPNRC